jgi:Leucine-rich repeat (LRR) protein
MKLMLEGCNTKINRLNVNNQSVAITFDTLSSRIEGLTWGAVDELIISGSVNNIEFVRHLNNIRSLNCNHTPIKSLEPLKNLTNLTSLNCCGTQITSLEPLKVLPKLSFLAFDSRLGDYGRYGEYICKNRKEVENTLNSMYRKKLFGII